MVKTAWGQWTMIKDLTAGEKGKSRCDTEQREGSEKMGEPRKRA